MSIECVPVKFEACDKDTKDLIFTIECFDETSATIEIKVPVDLDLWNKIKPIITSAIEKMELVG